MTSYHLERDLLTGKLEVPPTLLPREECDAVEDSTERIPLVQLQESR
jgi:hypothetical protein